MPISLLSAIAIARSYPALPIVTALEWSMVKVIKLAHVGLNALDLSKQAEFYNDKWGLERIDEFAGEMFFRAEGPAHHVLTLHEHAAAGMHHVALEVATSDE